MTGLGRKLLVAIGHQYRLTLLAVPLHLKPLHPDPCYDDGLLLSQLPRLESVLHDNPHVDVVVSSTWRFKRSITRLRELFSPSIQPRIIDVTPERRDFPDLADIIGHTYERSIEIEAWMRYSREPWRQWVALDDKAHWFRPFCKNLILCNPATGIDDQVELRLRQNLAR